MRRRQAGFAIRNVCEAQPQKRMIGMGSFFPETVKTRFTFPNCSLKQTFFISEQQPAESASSKQQILPLLAMKPGLVKGIRLSANEETHAIHYNQFLPHFLIQKFIPNFMPHDPLLS